jgi:hypothetical protein
MSKRFRTVFPKGHIVLPVIHVVSQEQAHRNADIARRAGALGVFLINHSMGSGELLAIHESTSRLLPDWWIGVNCLDLSPVDVVRRVSYKVAGIWSDNAMILETEHEQPEADEVMATIRETGWPGLYFGGVAFKYQRHVDDLSQAARTARQYMDVVTTSGPETGKAAHVEKIRAMKAALGDFPLAIASGITPENVQDYLPFSDCYLVATGVSDSFEEFNPDRVRALLNVVRTWDEGREQVDA